MKKRLYFPLLFLIGLLFVFLMYLFAERWLRALLLYLSTAVWAQQLVSKTSLAWRVASRFIAGETIADAINTARQLNEKGMSVTINYLGEHVQNKQEAVQAKDEIQQLLSGIHESGVRANVSVKPSQLGLNINPELLYQNLFDLLNCAQQTNIRIRVDMEESTTVDTTLGIYKKLRDEDGFGDHIGVVIQAYLYRSEEDIAALVADGARVRLCKGAYMEPPERAYPDKADTDRNYVKLSQMMLSPKAQQNGVHVAFATHDEIIIEEIINYTKSHQIPVDAFEFQMLFGIRRELQNQLVEKGYQVRIYVPYGTAWYPYFVRRLAERPANLWFFLSNYLRS